MEALIVGGGGGEEENTGTADTVGGGAGVARTCAKLPMVDDMPW